MMLIAAAYGVMLWIGMTQMTRYRRCSWACREATEWFWLSLGCMACFGAMLVTVARGAL